MKTDQPHFCIDVATNGFVLTVKRPLPRIEDFMKENIPGIMDALGVNEHTEGDEWKKVLKDKENLEPVTESKPLEEIFIFSNKEDMYKHISKELT